MFGDGPLTFQEFATREPLPLATIHDAVLEFLRGRKDTVLCGCHAVNAFVKQPRMTQDVDVLTLDSIRFTEEMRRFLRKEFHIAIRVNMRDRLGFRIIQPRKRGNRHLVDVVAITKLPPFQKVKRVQVLDPSEQIAAKVTCMVRCKGKPRAGLHQADLWRLVLAFPALKAVDGPVTESLRVAGASESVFALWRETVAQEIEEEADDDKFDY